MKEVILASKSPRRKELLLKCLPEFLCQPAEIDETINADNDLAEEVKKLSERKAMHILEKHPDAVVIGSDTIVVLNGKVLGKPVDEEEARIMLRGLQGTTHQVITGLCIVSAKKEYVDVTVSDVTFAPMTDDEIQAYLNTGEYKDKAGAYGIQGFGGKYITGISGDFYSIMGLPLNLVYEQTKNLKEY